MEPRRQEQSKGSPGLAPVQWAEGTTPSDSKCSRADASAGGGKTEPLNVGPRATWRHSTTGWEGLADQPAKENNSRLLKNGANSGAKKCIQDYNYKNIFCKIRIKYIENMNSAKTCHVTPTRREMERNQNHPPQEEACR